MILTDAPGAALAWLGRQGTRAVAISIFLGLALPQLAATLKPWVPEAIFALLVLAFLRVEPAALRGYFVRPTLLIAASLWMMVATPLVMGFLFVKLGLRESDPALFLALILQASAAPIMSAPAFAALLGLDAALSLATLIGAMALTPLTAPLFVAFFAGAEMAIAPERLALRLAGLLAGSAALAALIRSFAGRERIVANAAVLDGLNVVTLFVFAIAVMETVGALVWTRPALVLALGLAAFAIAIGTMVATLLVFLKAGTARAAALAWSAGNRNMGLMLAAVGGALPEITWLYFGLAQFPIYLLPQLLSPLARRWSAGPERP